MNAPIHPLVVAIREQREAAGLSQAAAAERAGMARPNWARVEGGGRAPTVETLERMAAAVGLRLELVDAGER